MVLSAVLAGVLAASSMLVPSAAHACDWCYDILQADLEAASSFLHWCYDTCESGAAGNSCRSDCYSDYLDEYNRAVEDYRDCVKTTCGPA